MDILEPTPGDTENRKDTSKSRKDNIVRPSLIDSSGHITRDDLLRLYARNFAQLSEDYQKIIDEFSKVSQLDSQRRSPYEPITSLRQDLNVNSSNKLNEFLFTFQTDQQISEKFLSESLIPYIKALINFQQEIDLLLGRSSSNPVIKEIKQYSPITVSGEGLNDALESIKNSVVPWRKAHQENLALLKEELMQASILKEHSLSIANRAISKKDENEAEKIRSEARLVDAQAEKILIEVERLKFELQKDYLKLAIEIVKSVRPIGSEEELLLHAIKLLPSLQVLVYSELEPTIINLNSEE